MSGDCLRIILEHISWWLKKKKEFHKSFLKSPIRRVNRVWGLFRETGEHFLSTWFVLSTLRPFTYTVQSFRAHGSSWATLWKNGRERVCDSPSGASPTWWDRNPVPSPSASTHAHAHTRARTHAPTHAHAHASTRLPSARHASSGCWLLVQILLGSNPKCPQRNTIVSWLISKISQGP